LWSRCLEIFLPAGYPHSVTNDYTRYGIHSFALGNARHSSISIDRRRKVPDLRKQIHSAVVSVHDLWQQDSLQAFSSSIAGLLASRAVLEGKLPGMHSLLNVTRSLTALSAQGLGWAMPPLHPQQLCCFPSSRRAWEG